MEIRKVTEKSTPNELARTINLLVDGYSNLFHMEKWTMEPFDYQEGTVVYADGTAWNPGSGAGIYQYRGGAWRFVG